MTKSEYIRKMYSILSAMCIKRGYHNVAAGMIAQSIQEGWNSQLANLYFNYWGMKAGDNYPGEKIAMDNKQKTDPAVYRVFTSMENGCEGYFKFLEYPRYRPLKNCATDLDYLSKIGPCGWNSNYKYGERCAKHLNDVYAALGQVPQETGQWQIGATYTTQQDLNIRKEPNGESVHFGDMTADAKAHSFISPSGNTVLRRGTRVTVKEIEKDGQTVWLRIPSGWICGKNSKNIYVL
jgi:hypothetical protein